MKEITQEWVNKAEEDYNVADRELKAKTGAYNAICFHSQQAAEKYLKALLQEMDIEFEKTHDLVFLYEKAKDKLTELVDMLEYLDELSLYAVEARYPGLTAEKEDAETAVKTMSKVREEVRKVLNIK